MPSVPLLFQMQVIDRRRVVQMIGRLEAEHVEKMNAVLRQMLKL
jgi:mRNA-degrading endonuclease toxin of MazEF toxin-antitoxin module